MGASTIVKALSEAVSEVSKLVGQIVGGKEVARLKYRTEAAMEYVFLDERVGQYKNITDKDREKKKIHFRKRIFDES